MSVLQEHKATVKMLFATITEVPITVHVNLDILEMDGLAKVNVTKALILFNEQGNGNWKHKFQPLKWWNWSCV